MDWTTLLQAAATFIGIVVLTASIVSVVLVARSKGTIDALKEAVNSYQLVAEARAEEIVELRKEIVELKQQVVNLQLELVAANSAVNVAVTETLKALKDFMVCPHCGEQMGGDE